MVKVGKRLLLVGVMHILASIKYIILIVIHLISVVKYFIQDNYLDMSKPKKEDIDITHDILYTSQSYNLRTPFIITNHSQHTYVFKVKTNQKQAIHMPKTHGFVAPQSASTLPLKIINKPNEKFDLKLQVSYGIASEEQIKSNVSQMLNFDPSKLLKHVITLRKLNLTANNQSAQYQQPSKIMPKQPKIHFSRQENPLNQQLEQFLLDYQKNNKKKLNVIASVPSLVKKRKNSSQSEQKFVINPLPTKRSQKSQDKIAMNGLQVQKNGKEQSFVSPMISEASQKNFPLKGIQLKNSHKFVQMPEYQKPLQERESLENETSKEESMLNLSKDRQIIQDLCKAEAERQKEIEEQKFKATEVETAQKMQQENQIQKQKEKELEMQLQKAIQIQLDSDTPEYPDCSINKLLSQPNNTVNLQKPDEIIDEQRLFNIFQRKQRTRTQNAQNLEQNSSVVKDVENENQNENDKTIRMQGSHEGQNILSPRQKPQTLVKTSRNRQISAENQISITENMNKTEKDRRKKSQISVQDKDEQNKQTVINGEIKQNDYSGCFFKDAKFTQNHNQAENQGRKYLQESTIIKFHQEQSNKVDLVDEVLNKRFLQTMVSQQSPFLYSFKYENGRNNKNVPDSRLQESVIICKYGNGQQIEILESEKMEDEKDKDINDLLINFMNHQTNHQMNLQEPKKQYCAINPFQPFNPSSLQDKILSKSSYLPKPQVPNMNHMKISEKNQAQKRANKIKGIAPLIIKRQFSSLDIKSQSNIKLHQLKSKEKIAEKIMEEIAVIQIKMECQEKFIAEINQVQEEYVKSLPRKYSWKLFLMGMILGLILGGLTKILLFPPKIKMSPKNNQALTSLTL